MLRKAGWFLGLAVLGMPLLTGAEPIAFEQAGNVTGMTGLEVGCDINYSYEKFESTGVNGIDENTIMEIPVFVRIGLPIMEIKLTIPYGSALSNYEAAESNDFGAIQNVGLGLKGGLLALPIFSLAVGLNTVFPTAEPEKYIFGEGLALNPYLAVDLDIMIMKLHANLGYEYRGEYEQDKVFNSSTGEFDPYQFTVKPGDATIFAVGVEIPAGDLFFLHAELVGTNYGEVKMDQLSIPDTAGSTFVFVPGVRLQKGIFKAKLGVAVPLEVEADRPDVRYAPRSDWRIMGGVSLLFGL